MLLHYIIKETKGKPFFWNRKRESCFLDFCFYIHRVYFYFLFRLDTMPSFSSRLSQDIEKFYPNETLLPKNAFAKGVLFTLGVVGFATMFLQPSVAQDGGNLSVDTSLTNNIMSVGKLSVIN